MKRAREESTPSSASMHDSKYRRVAPKVDGEGFEGRSLAPEMASPYSGRSSQGPIGHMQYGSPPHSYPGSGHAFIPPYGVSPGQPIQQVGPGSANGSPGSGAPPYQGRVKFETALDFLDQVKTQFSSQPSVYRQFLKIMKDFKSQEIDTPGVINRVSELFKGHNHLIMGFNKFLPEGYKIENEMFLPPMQHHHGMVNPVPIAPQLQVPPVSPNQQAMMNPQHAAAAAAATAKQPELDHARNFVKRIKVRFEKQPETYKTFLSILHTYHKENHTISEVYEQVAELFHDHPDLLAEFKQFLPDNQAPGQQPIPAPRRTKKMSAAAAASAASAAQLQGGAGYHPSAAGSAKARNLAMEGQKVPKQGRRKAADEDHTVSIRHSDKEASREDLRPKRGQSSSSAGNGQGYGGHASQFNVEEFDFFYRIKRTLRNDSLYNDFIKCLHLFNVGIISKAELTRLLADLFEHHPEIFDEIRIFADLNIEDLQDPDAAPKTHMQLMSFGSRADVDFRTCKRYGPSYRALPPDYQQPPCTGRAEVPFREVLNDCWVSVPTGSEDGSFKAARKNQFEEVLFKCEDDRYELDMVIELNLSTIRAFEMIIRQIMEFPRNDLAHFRVEPLDIQYVRSIERIYGTKGKEMIQLIYNNPVVAVPIVLRRLRTKDQEWRKVRSEWNKIWREINEKNYHKALDHQSFYFKQKEKKTLTTKELVQEIKNQKNNGDGKKKVAEIKFEFKTTRIFADITHIIRTFISQTLSKSEREKIETFLSDFLSPFFQTALMESTNPFNTTSSSSSSSGTGAQTDKGHSTLFFGNKASYIFFRLYQLLYHRLETAHEIAKTAHHQQRASSVKSIINAGRPNVPKERLFHSVEEMYDYYVNDLLLPFATGDLETNKYEDECRQTLGISSYVLFTMDKLVPFVVRQIQDLVMDETASKLLSLHQYESKRSNGFVEHIYHSNSLKYLGDKRCYRVEFSLGRSKVLSLQMLDISNQPKLMELNSQKWNQYVETYVQNESSGFDVRKHHIFMLRNMIKNQPKAMENLEIDNKLTGKLCLSTYRLFYVEETEDYYYRKGQMRHSQRSHNSSRQCDRLHHLMESRSSSHNFSLTPSSSSSSMHDS
eukprot:TRINITY_DN433_c0_g2_i2.p1 TRINITY_DN433_c0_g2~~TRINITY_DN433_c0_g2_i2.p1  ORF type:complete len:1109 (-),score=559.54 TRINITY_DN433_c0_g2_i2:192-3518(-)